MGGGGVGTGLADKIKFSYKNSPALLVVLHALGQPSQPFWFSGTQQLGGTLLSILGRQSSYEEGRKNFAFVLLLSPIPASLAG